MSTAPPIAPAAHSRYRFAGHEVDVPRRRVTTPDGRVVAIPSRAFDVLAYLLEHHTRVVGKNELIRAVWPGLVVEENNLDQAVSALRRALGDTPATRRFVVTVPGRGFQFVAPVDVSEAAASHAHASAPSPPAADEEAWRLYLHGRLHWERKSADGMRQAVEFYQAAIERDPSFAPPRVGLADAFTTQAVFGVRPPRGALDDARAQAARAIELDPTYAEAYAALGHVVAQRDRDWDEAARLQEQALRLKPTYGHAVMWRAMLHAYRSDLPAALGTIRQAQVLEPMSLSFSALAGLLMYFAREFDASARHLRAIVETVPDASLARQFYARSLLAQGRADEVIMLLEGREALGPWSMSNLARAYAYAGRREAAQAGAAQARELGARGFGVGVDLALIHLALDEPEHALGCLERAVEDLSQTAGYLRIDPAFDPIRDEPRFRAVSRRLGLG